MKKILCFLSLFFVSFAGSVFAIDPWLEGEDTIAGQDIPVRVSGLLSEEVVNVKLIRPDGTSIPMGLIANDVGSVSTNISGLHTHDAGVYDLVVTREYGNDLYETIDVFAGDPSPYRSSITFEKESAPADGESILFFNVQARDAYGNPVEGSKVRVLSSRNKDIVSIAGTTNSSGVASGKVVSDTPGISIMSVLVDDEVLTEKPEVVFHLSDSSGKAVGQGLGQFLRAQVFDEEGTLSELGYFDIEGIPDEVEAGKPVSVTITARDQNGLVFPQYDGTVRFVSSDNKVEPPADYTFDQDDQGVHPFFLAVTFGTPGDHTFSVHDLNDFEKKATVNVRVVPKEGTTVTDAPPTAGTIQVITPEHDSLFRTSRLTISGRAPGLSAVKVRFGLTQVVADNLQVAEDGSFLYQTPTLSDGIYEFTVLSTDELVASDTVRVTVDRTPPSSMAVSVSPEGEKQVNEIFTVNLNSGEELASAQCVFNEAAYTLVPQSEGLYSIDVAAPAVCGEYPLSCSVADAVGNKLEEANAAVVNVSCNTDPVVTPPAENSAPTAPTNVSGKPGTGKVTLFWSPSLDDVGVSNYQVSYVKEGTREIQSNTVPDNRTQWYIDGLEACAQYKFTVTAVDDSGQTSVPSEVVNQGPECDKETHSSAPKTTDSGAGIPWVWMMLSLIVGGSVVSLARRS